MNTPAHAIVNILILARGGSTRAQLVVSAGALLPDAPMFVFYFVERVIRKTPEQVIWTQSYYRESWQSFIDYFNSAPLIGLGIAVALITKARLCLLFFVSMGLHVLADFPLHHDDAHRHFFPLSNWRFASPISYWDPRHYGLLVSSLEATVVVLGCVIIFNCSPARPSRIVLGLLGGSYMAYWGYAWLAWG